MENVVKIISVTPITHNVRQFNLEKPEGFHFNPGQATELSINEKGWKDTIIAPPGQVTRIIIPFGGTAAGIAAPFVGDSKTASVQRFAGTYVFHCHILEHEDNDMMQPYKVG